MEYSPHSDHDTTSRSASEPKCNPNRKPRVPKACYPCYKRKVKCDRTLPCSLCVKRGYANLCTFTHPVKKVPTTQARRRLDYGAGTGGNITKRKTTATATTTVSAAMDVSGDIKDADSFVLLHPQEWQTVQDRLAVLSKSLHSLCSQVQDKVSPVPAQSFFSSTAIFERQIALIQRQSEKQSWISPETSPKNTRTPTPTPSTTSSTSATSEDADSGGVRTHNALGGSPIYCGSDSITAFLLKKSSTRTVFAEGGVLSQLALDNQLATYPFLDLWSSNIDSCNYASVCAALPDDDLCWRLLQSYRDVRLTLYPVIADFDAFEEDVRTLFANRAFHGRLGATSAPFGFNISYIGILFAVLAAGSQVSDFPRTERTQMCQRYVSCAYQCLRLGNFLSQPSLDAVHSLLIIGDVLSYNMNPGIAYVIFGVAQRIAISLGLHAESARIRDSGALNRQRLWWCMAWQDSHFGLSYDRPIETLSLNPHIPRDANSRSGNRGYFETMCSIVSLILQLLRSEVLEGNKISDHVIPAYRRELDQIILDAAPRLRNRHDCVTTEDHIQRLTLKLRSSYLISEICRRSLKPSSSGLPVKQKAATSHLCRECIDSLVDTIEAFIDLHTLIPRGSRSWIFLHSAISAAFLLSVDEGAQVDPTVCSVLKRLEKVFEDLVIGGGGDDYHLSNLQQQQQQRQDSTTLSPESTTTLPGSNIQSSSSSRQDLPGIGPVPLDKVFAMAGISDPRQTFMLSDFPLSAESLMMNGRWIDDDQGGGGGGGGANNSFDPFSQQFSSRTATEPDRSVQFLMSTLNSLRKINSEFKAQNAAVKSSSDGFVSGEKRAGGCCMSRTDKRGPKAMSCH